MSLTIPDQTAAHEGLVNDTAKRSAGVRRLFVALLQVARIDHELFLGIPRGEIGIASWCDRALAIAQSGERSRRRAHPARERLQAEAAASRAGPHRRQRDIERRD